MHEYLSANVYESCTVQNFIIEIAIRILCEQGEAFTLLLLIKWCFGNELALQQYSRKICYDKNGKVRVHAKKFTSQSDIHKDSLVTYFYYISMYKEVVNRAHINSTHISGQVGDA